MVTNWSVCGNCLHPSHIHPNGGRCNVRGCPCRKFVPKES